MQNDTFRLSSGRDLPLLLKVQVISGGVMGIVGLAFLIFSIFFIVIMGYFAAFNDFFISSNSPVTEGIVTSAENTSSSVNDQAVVKYSFTFNTAKTGEITGSCFSEKASYTIGQNVTIQYSDNNPQIAVIKGTRTGEMPVPILLIMVPFFLIGSILSYFAIRNGLRNLQLITDGVLTKGKFLRRESTNVMINDRPVYKMFFSFKTPDGRSFEMFSKTHQPERLTDEAEEMLIYNPSTPEKAVAVDSLPSIVRRFFTNKSSV